MLPTDYRTKVPTWLAAYRNSNCAHSQSETFVRTGILAVCLAPAIAAAPCSVCVQRLLQCLSFLGTATAARRVLLPRLLCGLAETLSAKPQL